MQSKAQADLPAFQSFSPDYLTVSIAFQSFPPDYLTASIGTLNQDL